MSFRMSWNTLLCEERFRKNSEQPSSVDGRNAFENDYTRVVFSSAVRRLQDKAQVFPLDNSDFVRTRLTHSLEVSAIGRSLGASIESQLYDKNKTEFPSIHFGKIGAILATAGLVHDLGNPPFGHFGEKVIRGFLNNWFEKGHGQVLTREEKADFLFFEGNAQTFRLLQKLQYLIDQNGFNLTFATLASLVKYPRSSVEGNVEKGKVSYKKFGYFQSEKSAFERIKDATGIGAHRHPLALLLEAIDDIAYSAADIEDGFKKGVLTFDIIKGVLGQKLDFSVEEENLLFKKIDEYLNEVHPDYPEKQAIAVQRFRIKAQGVMIESVVKAFMDNLEQIFTGNFDEELLLVSKAKNLRLAFKFLAEEYVFKDKSIILKELVGEKVISCLLSSFVEAVTADDRLKGSTKVGKLYYLVSPNYKFIMDNFPSELDDERKPSLYDRLLLATDFICGMTDSYALELYHNLSGIKL